MENNRHVFLLGAAKAGSTSLSVTLNRHPDIHLSPAKETRFFQLNREYDRGLEYYRRSYFPDRSSGQYLLDAAHRHLYLPWIPDRILSLLPDAKFVVILRNPVERAHSHYWHWRRSGRTNTESLPFEQALHQDLLRIEAGLRHQTKREKQRYQRHLTEDAMGIYRTYLDSGYYHEQITRYTEQTGRDRVKVVLFKEFIEDPDAIANQIFRFLDLEERSVHSPHTNKGFVPRLQWLQSLYSRGRTCLKNLGLLHLVPTKMIDALRSINAQDKSQQTMNPVTERWLYDHYSDHNQRLESFLEQSLPGWTHRDETDDWEPVRSDVFGEGNDADNELNGASSDP